MKVKYQYKDKVFDNLKDIKKEVEDVIGKEVMELITKKTNVEFKDLLKLFEIITSKHVRTVLNECLNVEVEVYNQKLEKLEVMNILDL